MNRPTTGLRERWSRYWQPAHEPFGGVARQVVVAVLTTTGITLLARGMEPWLHLPGVVMLFFLAVVLSAYGSGVYASGLCAILSVGAFNYFFVEPRHSLLVDAPESWLTLAGLLMLSALVSSLTLRLQMATRHARAQQQQAEQARQMLERLVGLDSRDEMLRVACSRMGHALDADIQMLEPQAVATWTLHTAYGERWVLDQVVIAETSRQGRPSPWIHELVPPYVCMPLEPAPGPGLVLSARPRWRLSATASGYPSDWMDVLRVLSQQLGLALQRERATRQAQEARTAKEREALRNTFLTSVAHDLRSPLASILAATSSMKTAPAGQHPALLDLVEREVRHMSNITDNVLTLVRLTDAPDTPLLADWESLEEIIGSVLVRHRQRHLHAHPMQVTTRVPSGLPWVWVDGPLLSQWLDNLLDNAARYAPGSSVEVMVERQGQGLVLHVQDRGGGYPLPWTGLLTARFVRGDQQSPGSGFGLGLSICQAIADAHHARFELGVRTDGLSGARASIWLERLWHDPVAAPLAVGVVT
jgi:two-component system, OmpR family, sensor histidine kinase KdpD